MSETRILLVEDEPGYARLLREILAETPDLPHRVTLAASLTEALALLERGQFEIILLDLGLPDADGIEALESVSAIAPEIPIVVLSALNDLNVALQSMRVGAQEYLVKGQSEHVLLSRAVRYAIERKQLQRSAVEARAEAERANAAKDQFLAMLGHELRNPLTPIVAALRLIEERADPAIARERATMDRQVKHLVRLVDDLLDVSRIVRGKLELHWQTVNLADSIAESVEAASPLFEQAGHTLEVKLPDPPLFVRGDRTRLAQVFTNLLTNAARYTGDGGKISVTLGTRGDDAELVVRDNGVGITQELLPRVFQLFEQGERKLTRSAGGLGLGLALVKSIVELHGGSVTAHSAGAGAGSEFRIRLPHVRKKRGSAPSDRPPAPDAGPSRRVLIVDDNVDGAEMLALNLDRMGHATRVAHDGSQALVAAREFHPQIVLLDIGLPVMDGYEVALKLREEGGAHTPVLIAISGYGQDADRKRSAESGFAHHLVKPIDIRMLEGLLRSVASK